MTSHTAAATLDESIPPERKTPIGTSARRCRSTAARNSGQNASAAAAKPGGATPASGHSGRQYRPSLVRPFSQTRNVAGGSFFTPAQIECGAGTYS